MTETFSIFLKRKGKMSSELLEWKEHLLLSYRDLNLTFEHRHYWSHSNTRKDCDLWSMTWDLVAVSNFVRDLSRIARTKVNDYTMGYRSSVHIHSDNNTMPFLYDNFFLRDWDKKFLKPLRERYDKIGQLEQLLRVWMKKHYDLDVTVFDWGSDSMDLFVVASDKDGNECKVTVDDLLISFKAHYKQGSRKIHSKKLLQALKEHYAFRWDGEL